MDCSIGINPIIGRLGDILCHLDGLFDGSLKHLNRPVSRSPVLCRFILAWIYQSLCLDVAALIQFWHGSICAYSCTNNIRHILVIGHFYPIMFNGFLCSNDTVYGPHRICCPTPIHIISNMDCISTRLCIINRIQRYQFFTLYRLLLVLIHIYTLHHWYGISGAVQQYLSSLVCLINRLIHHFNECCYVITIRYAVCNLPFFLNRYSLAL